MAQCVDSPRSGIIGCGVTYTGERQHCVARAPWSTHPDGRAHITGALSTIDKMWQKGGAHPAHPADCGYVELEPGRWGTAMTEAVRATRRGTETPPE
jgi:hypothetical protein